MRELIISEAPAARIATVVKEVVEDAGGVVALHNQKVTRFDHLGTREDNWSRSGYLGTYQPFQGRDVRVRVRVWASWPRRLLRFFVFLGLAEALLFFALAVVGAPPSANTWIWTAIVTIVGIGVALLTYATSWSASTEVEEALARRIGATAREDPEVEGDVYTVGAWRAHRKELIEEAVEDVEPTEPAERRGFLRRRVEGAVEEADEEGSAKRGLFGRFRKGEEAEEEPAVGEHEEPSERRGLLGRFRRGDDADASSPEEAEEPAEKSRRRLGLRRKRDA